MGIIEKQTLKGSFFSYLGVAMGFITVGLLWPRFLEPEEIGLINFLIAVSTILAHVGSLGINSVSIRLFPYFRDNENRHNGFLSMALLFVSAGVIIILIYYLLFRDKIITNNIEKSNLIANYAYLIVPFTIATLLFNLFDSLHKVIYNAVIGVFVKDFIFRLLNLVLISLYAWFTFRFHLFLNLYFILFSVPALVLIILLYRTHQFNLSLKIPVVTRSLRRSIVDVSLFGLMGGMGTLAISNIDKIMINRLIDLEATGIYSIAFLFGTIITLPSRPLGKIATTIIAEAWKRSDTDTIKTIYLKSCLNQFIFSGLIFLLVWLNIDLVFKVIPTEYAVGKYVILFMSLAGVVEMATGLNGMIISTSKYYRYQSVFILFLLILVVLTNWFFIPRFGITGAAMASLLSTIVYNMVRAGFLYLKFQMQPFNYRFLVVLASLLAALFAGYLLQGIENWLTRTILICLSIVGLYLIPLYFFRISVDINNSISTYYRSLFSKLKNR
ncbi:MAG: oligosaccharide flippase family protein [Bacteroidota bacterium]